MQFENRQVAEGVNVTKVHPLKQFMQLLIATVILVVVVVIVLRLSGACLLYTSPSPRDRTRSRMPSSA